MTNHPVEIFILPNIMYTFSNNEISGSVLNISSRVL
jgi:hypothetical protein